MPNPKVAPPTPPPFLAQVPKGAVRRLEASTLLRDALTASAANSAPGSILALYNIEAALAAAERQQRRIAHGKRQLAQRLPTRNSGTVFDDIHFYLICWARIAKLSRFISRVTRFRRVGLVLRRYRQELDDMIDARDHLEHFEERLPGGTKRHLLHQQHDLFNMVGDHMTFGGRKFDVGRKSVEVLGAIVAELRDAILFDSLEVLAGADPKLLIRRLRQAQRDASTARLIRRAEAEFQKRTPAEPNAR